MWQHLLWVLKAHSRVLSPLQALLPTFERWLLELKALRRMLLFGFQVSWHLFCKMLLLETEGR